MLSAPPSWRGPDHEEIERKAHMIRLVEIADALELSEEQALKLKTKLDQFDQKLKPLYAEMKAQAEVVHQAAQGEATAMDHVDAAILKIRALREQIRQLDEQLFDQLSKGLDHRHKARLARAMAHLPWEMRSVFHEHTSGGPGEDASPR
jgi:hypothetical protein